MHRPITRLILEAAVAAVLRRADAVINRTMPLLEAGECWLEQTSRDQTPGPARGRSLTIPGSGRSTLTPQSLRSAASLEQANDPQRLRSFLQRVAEAHGSASAKKAKSVLHGVIGYAVDNGVLPSDAPGTRGHFHRSQVKGPRPHSSHDT